MAVQLKRHTHTHIAVKNTKSRTPNTCWSLFSPSLLRRLERHLLIAPPPQCFLRSSRLDSQLLSQGLLRPKSNGLAKEPGNFQRGAVGNLFSGCCFLLCCWCSSFYFSLHRISSCATCKSMNTCKNVEVVSSRFNEHPKGIIVLSQCLFHLPKDTLPRTLLKVEHAQEHLFKIYNSH